MDSPYLFGDFDVAELCLLAFFGFFLGLIFYLRREDRREGYPLEDDVTGRLETLGGVLFNATPKVFLLPHGHGSRSYPDRSRDSLRLAARRSAPMEGAPIEPTGDALVDGIGPGAYANRPDYPDLTLEGLPRIVPMHMAHGIFVAPNDPDPRGMAVVGADGLQAGVVTDVWADRSELLIRYLELGVGGVGGRRVLVPMGFAVINGDRRTVTVRAIRSDQFMRVPALANPEQITLLEEDRIMGYYGGGLLYATPDRQEPWL